MFELHERLAVDSVLVAKLPLSQLRLARDARFPWALLVPERPDISEMTDLAPADQGQLMTEIDRVSRALRQLHSPDRINVAALGNMVPQLHVHVVARFREDVAWPGPISGVGQACFYDEVMLIETCKNLKKAVGDL